VVFVADSQSGRSDTNQEALDDLHDNLTEHNRTLDEVPHTFHWNKRDLADLVPVADLERRFNKLGAPSLGTVATKGEGVFEGLERITRLVLKSYETDPKVRIDASAEPSRSEGRGAIPLPEEGIARALREMEEQGAVEAPTKLSVVVPEGIQETRRGESPRPPSVEGHGATSSSKGGSGAHALTVKSAPPSHPSSPTKGDERIESGRPGSGFSLAELWPESDRESVRQAEAMLAARDAVNAILACDVLVTRVLASAAGLVGTLDAPRDPAVVALLLGLDGPRYLQFRMLVRAARHREPVTMKDAFEGLAFALEARRAREHLRR
jgi:hypothetical protein